jgi:outer membrane lipoprotein carrier protein
MRNRIATILILGALAVASLFADSRVDAIASAVDRHYNGLRSLQTQFTETYHGAGMSREESGTLWLKHPGKMRWDYSQPRKKEFISDGKNAYFYVQGEPQATRADVKSLDDLRSPLRYLLGKTRLQQEFEGLSIAPDVQPEEAGDVVLRGIPKNMKDRVSQVLLEITPDSQIRRILIEEVDGSTTEFRFRDPKENVAVADSFFHFTPPPGVEILESTNIVF